MQCISSYGSKTALLLLTAVVLCGFNSPVVCTNGGLPYYGGGLVAISSTMQDVMDSAGRYKCSDDVITKLKNIRGKCLTRSVAMRQNEQEITQSERSIAQFALIQAIAQLSKYEKDMLFQAKVFLVDGGVGDARTNCVTTMEDNLEEVTQVKHIMEQKLETEAQPPADLLIKAGQAATHAATVQRLLNLVNTDYATTRNQPVQCVASDWTSLAASRAKRLIEQDFNSLGVSRKRQSSRRRLSKASRATSTM